MSSYKIAQTAGVSKATVSRVLNNAKNVSPETRKKVLDAIETLGILPRTRSKKKYAKNVMALIIGRDLFMEYSPARWRMLYGIQQVTAKHNVNLFTYQLLEQNDIPSELLNGLDGIIIMGKTNNKEVLKAISDIPSVWINSMGSVNKDMALARNQLVGQMAAQHLISRGHKNLAFFKVLMNHPAIEMDGDFFEFTAIKSGCNVSIIKGIDVLPDQDEVETWGMLYNIAKKAAKTLAKMTPQPTGLFIPLGTVVNVSYRYLQEENIYPGRDIDIISCGCENAMLASLSPRPSNISINVETIGRRAAEQILWKINNPTDTSPVNITVIPTLITR